MKRWEELALKWLDGGLEGAERAEWERCLRQPGVRAASRRLFLLEAALRRRRLRFEVREAVLTRLRAQLAEEGASLGGDDAEMVGPGVRPRWRLARSCALGVALVLTTVAIAFSSGWGRLSRPAGKAEPTRAALPGRTAERGASGLAAWRVRTDGRWPVASRFRAWYFEPALGGPALATSADGAHWTPPRRLRGVRADTSEFAVLFEPERGMPYRFYYLAAGVNCAQIRVAESVDGVEFTETRPAIRTLSFGARGLAVTRAEQDPLPYRLFYQDALSGRMVFECSPDGDRFEPVDYLKLAGAPPGQALMPLSLSRSAVGLWSFHVANPAGEVSILTSTNGLEWAFPTVLGATAGTPAAAAPPPLSPTSGSWDFYSPMDDWQTEGWLMFSTSGNTPDGEQTAVIQNEDGTVSIRDLRPRGNFYLTHDAAWTTPFTVELRARVDRLEGTDSDANCPKFTVAAMMRDSGTPGPQVWQPAFGADRLGAWDLEHGPAAPGDHRRFHTFTVICRFDRAAAERLRLGAGDAATLRDLCVFDLYVDRDFRAPRLSYHNTGFAGWGSVDADGRLDIGLPWPSAGQLTVDWVRWGNGVILDPAEPRPMPLLKVAEVSRRPTVEAGWQMAASPQGPWSELGMSSLAAPPPVFGFARFFRPAPSAWPPPVRYP